MAGGSGGRYAARSMNASATPSSCRAARRAPARRRAHRLRVARLARAPRRPRPRARSRPRPRAGLLAFFLLHAPGPRSAGSPSCYSRREQTATRTTNLKLYKTCTLNDVLRLQLGNFQCTLSFHLCGSFRDVHFLQQLVYIGRNDKASVDLAKHMHFVGSRVKEDGMLKEGRLGCCCDLKSTENEVTEPETSR